MIVVEIKGLDCREGELNTIREFLVDFFQTDFQIELESNLVRFKNN